MDDEIVDDRESRLRETVATTFPARTVVFGIVLAVSVLMILLALTWEENWGSLSMVILAVIAIVSVVNLVMGIMWCSNTSWGKGRQLVLWSPCGLCCDERDEWEGEKDDVEKPRP